MWKSIVLCVSLFGGAALGLALGARFVEPGALPAAAAIGLCVIGVVLILAAPTDEPAIGADDASQVPATTRVTGVRAAAPLELGEAVPVAAATPTVSDRTPTRPFEALNG
jgi:hypothetical protein